ncbi:phytanoyl-CoA dioxygenase family protein [Mucilaginibacter dorajii]|uniref:Phytanoyl-CoA dioxygenase family protein n=1 Tax=Mucilaginibacter dorajii TaxID=692994 RepID=A0ABP7PWT6_9SPHI|nr:phytanoyl-CoA dioxygenase family protein [Mucilaginibacter dorajii]MCS3737257.1 ectoine hydroxylase-related dioxygenase (phytanoyl-CoA dioxygenase family) [Mucilaginibacter dorajii]
MDNHLTAHRQEIVNDGFTVINGIYTNAEVKSILDVIASANQSNPAFRKTDDLFAIRQFLKELPQVVPLIFNDKLKAIITALFDQDYFVTKSIYFDKPELSNWFVAWHQDLTIVVDKKTDVEGYGPWTVKQNQFGVQPPLPILKDNFTIRIHLDDTNEANGALKAITGSHLKDIYRPETIDWNIETETTCNVNAGGFMIMRPLLLHASNRTTNNQKRRVVHIEFSRADLDGGLGWAEKLTF